MVAITKHVIVELHPLIVKALAYFIDADQGHVINVKIGDNGEKGIAYKMSNKEIA